MPNSTRESRDEAAYAAVLAELRNGVRDEPLMAKAYAEAEGDENKARALYLRWRSTKLMKPFERERQREFDDVARLARQLKRSRKPGRSWSHPRAYDFLLIAAALVVLFLFNRDVHNAVVHLVYGLGRW